MAGATTPPKRRRTKGVCRSCSLSFDRPSPGCPVHKMVADREATRCILALPEGWDPPSGDRKGWSYRVPEWIGELAVGDHIIVENPRDAQTAALVPSSGRPLCAVVTNVRPTKEDRRLARRWVVQRIDWEPYKALVAMLGENDGLS